MKLWLHQCLPTILRELVVAGRVLKREEKQVIVLNTSYRKKSDENSGFLLTRENEPACAALPIYLGH